MAEYRAPQDQTTFKENFAPLKPLMNDTQAYYESARCLFCYDAPCIQACPTGIDIPLFIRQINSGNPEGAAKTIYEANWFGYACGKVCPTEVLCEGACVYNHQDVKPIEIGRLQSFATNEVIRTKKKLFKCAEDNGKSVAVIGAGPAGVSAACELRMLGFKVDIFEAKAHPSGLTIYGVAPYKISNEEALNEMSYLQDQFDFEINYKQPVDAEKLKALSAKYDAVFIGVGLGATSKTGIPGEMLEGCFGAVEFVEALRMQEANMKVAQKVVVLGGGNTAMDAASESARMGAAHVTLAYRRSKKEMGAYAFEYDLAKGAGVEGLFNASPVAILGNNNKVERIRFIRTETINGKLQPIEGSEFEIETDWVIRATGQSKQKAFLSQIEGIQLDEKGRIKVNAQGQTNNPKIFAAGDAVNGGVEVVNAVAEAKIAAHGIKATLLS